jgi:hypothetical protein
MTQFKVKAEIQVVRFEEHYHARLLSRRGDHDAVVGVFQLYPAEWEIFQEVCANADIEITYEPARTLSTQG